MANVSFFAGMSLIDAVMFFYRAMSAVKEMTEGAPNWCAALAEQYPAGSVDRACIEDRRGTIRAIWGYILSEVQLPEPLGDIKFTKALDGEFDLLRGGEIVAHGSANLPKPHIESPKTAAELASRVLTKLMTKELAGLAKVYFMESGCHVLLATTPTADWDSKFYTYDGI